MNSFFEKHQAKAVKCLIESIDNGEHNDVDIILDDGVIRASKLILSSRSEYFQKMFDKKSQFVKQKQNSVKFFCKKHLMMKILTHIYGGDLLVSDLTCLEIVEMQDILRLLLLEDASHVLKRHVKEKFMKLEFSIRECFDAVEIAHSLKLENMRKKLLLYLIIFMDDLVNDYIEDIEALSAEIILNIFAIIHKRESSLKFQVISTHYKEISKLKFIQIWAESNTEDLTEELKQTIFQCFDLTKFSVGQLLGDVRNSKLFSDEEVFEAVKTVNVQIKKENFLKKFQDRVRELESNRN